MFNHAKSCKHPKTCCIFSIPLITTYSCMKPCKSIFNRSFKGNGNAFGCVCECGLIIWGFIHLANCVCNFFVFFVAFYHGLAKLG